MHGSNILVGLLCTLALSSPARACGDWLPKHGGQMNHDGGEVAFELVGQGREVTLHLEDHGQPIPTAAVQGVLSFERDGKGLTSTLKPAGGNRMAVRLPSALRKGDKLVADISLPNGAIAKGAFVYGVEVQLRTRFGAPMNFAAPPR
ncbi:hypothetical protein V4F39_01015 [Aquincola sp. MAHUQ-54]|uniref:Copper chaperone PCu(A)C n=1 Tax=Aquincola agrisoli TaxID=3119538 RepID=A0AAW9QAQ6_9BURK